jgi:hypothetical protein
MPAHLGETFVARQCRLARMIHDHERSTTHLRGRTTKPFALGVRGDTGEVLRRGHPRRGVRRTAFQILLRHRGLLVGLDGCSLLRWSLAARRRA